MKGHPLPPAVRRVEHAAITTAWEIMSDQLKAAARDHGYALTLHGSMARDLDLVAIPWVEHGVDDPEALVNTFCGILRGLFGRANHHDSWSEKPHGRRATTIMIWGGWQIIIDLSVLPRVNPAAEAN